MIKYDQINLGICFIKNIHNKYLYKVKSILAIRIFLYYSLIFIVID